jgi:hypothetical protein
MLFRRADTRKRRKQKLPLLFSPSQLFRHCKTLHNWQPVASSAGKWYNYCYHGGGGVWYVHLIILGAVLRHHLFSTHLLPDKE